MKRMGFIVEQGILRPPLQVFAEGEEVGTLTSGTYSPILKKGIGFAFIRNDLAKPDIRLKAN